MPRGNLKPARDQRRRKLLIGGLVALAALWPLYHFLSPRLPTYYTLQERHRFLGSNFQYNTSPFRNSLSSYLLLQVEGRRVATGEWWQDSPLPWKGRWVEDWYQRKENQDTAAKVREAVQTASQAASRLIDVPDPELNGFVLSPDGSRLAAAGQGRVFLWDFPAGAPRGTLEPERAAPILTLAFHPDSRRLATGDELGVLRLWDVESQTEVAASWVRPSPIRAVAITPDGAEVIAGTGDGALGRFGAGADGARLQGGWISDSQGEASSGILSLAVHRNGDVLVSGQENGEIRLWDLTTGQPLETQPEGHPGAVHRLAFHPTEDFLLISLGSEGSLRFWNGRGREPLREISLTRHSRQEIPLAGLSFSPDGKTLAARHRLLDLETGLVQEDHIPYGAWLTFSPDGRFLIAFFNPDDLSSTASAFSRRHLRVLDRDAVPYPYLPRSFNLFLPSPLALPLGNHRGEVLKIAFADDGAVFATGSRDGTVRLWDTVIRSPLSDPLPTYSGGVRDLAFQPGTHTLAVATTGGLVHLWNGRTGEPVAPPLSGHGDSVEALAFHPDGITLATGTADGVLHLWNTADWKPLRLPLRSPDGSLSSLSFHPDGNSLASAGPSGTVRLWRRHGDRFENWPLEPLEEPILQIRHGPDGQYLVASKASGEMEVWLLETGALGKSQSINEYAHRFAFHGEDDWGVSTGHEGHLQHWVAGTSTPWWSQKPPSYAWVSRSVEKFGFHFGGAGSVAFSPDGRVLVSGGLDGSVWLWEQDPDLWVEKACEIANRNLTLAEWHEFVGKQYPYRCTCPQFPAGEGAPPTAPGCPAAG